MKATFEFELDTAFPLSLLAFRLHLNWSQVSDNHSGVIRYPQQGMAVERVGQTGTYRLSVPLRLLGEGRLLVNLTIDTLQLCLGYYPWYREYHVPCQWLIRVTSGQLEISAKRG